MSTSHFLITDSSGGDIADYSRQAITAGAATPAATQLEFLELYSDYLVHEQLDIFVEPRGFIVDQPFDFRPAYVSIEKFKTEFSSILTADELVENAYKLARQNWVLSKARLYRADRQQWLFATIWRKETEQEIHRSHILDLAALKKQQSARFFDEACLEHGPISCEFWAAKRLRNGSSDGQG